MKINRFEIKEEHIILIKNMYVEWNHGENGAPTIDPKRPYGNSSVEYDIAKFLDWKIEDNELSIEQIYDAYKLHRETVTALQICLNLLKFETGKFENIGYGNNWKKLN